VDNVAAGVPREEILRSYPALTDPDIEAALAYAAELTREGTVDLPLEIKAWSLKSTKTFQQNTRWSFARQASKQIRSPTRNFLALAIREDENTMPMKNPTHPGLVVRHDCLEPLGLSVTAGAKVLGVTRQALNNVVNGKSGISPEMAIRLSKAFGSTPETWLRMQVAYDLAAARKNESKIKVHRQHLEEQHIYWAHAEPRMIALGGSWATLFESNAGMPTYPSSNNDPLYRFADGKSTFEYGKWLRTAVARLPPTCPFFFSFPFAPQLTTESILQPVRRTLCCLDQFAGNKTSNEPVSSSVFGVVINEQIVCMLASLR
jgi:addiction module HigA family antidote